jgi:hypothetical protein
MPNTKKKKQPAKKNPVAKGTFGDRFPRKGKIKQQPFGSITLPQTTKRKKKKKK